MADFLDDATIIAHESGGNPYIGWRNTDLRPYLQAGKVTASGFPDWPGLPSGTFDKNGRELPSTAGGLYGITKTNYNHYGPLVGVTDFTPESQKKVKDAIMADQGPNAWLPYWSKHRSADKGLQSEGYYGGATHLNVGGSEGPGQSGTGGDLAAFALLDNLITKQRYAADAEPPKNGNDLLSLLVAGAQTRQEGTKPQEASQEPKPASPPPAPVPDPGNAFSSYVEPPDKGALPPEPAMPSFPQGDSQLGTQDNPLIQEGAGGAPVGARDVPGSLDKNRFWNENGVAPYNAPGVPDDRMQEVSAPPKTGAELLNQLAGGAGMFPEPGQFPVPIGRPNLAAAFGMKPVDEQIAEQGERETELRQKGAPLSQQVLAPQESPFAGAFQPGIIGMARGVRPPPGGPPREPPNLRVIQGDESLVQRPFDTGAPQTANRNDQPLGQLLSGGEEPHIRETIPGDPSQGFDVVGPLGNLYAQSPELAQQYLARQRAVAGTPTGGGDPARAAGGIAEATPSVSETQAPATAAGSGFRPPTGTLSPTAGSGVNQNLPAITNVKPMLPAPGGSGPPAIIPPGGRGVGPAAPPPPGPGMVPPEMVRAETAPEAAPPRADAPIETPVVKKLRLQAMHSTQDKMWTHWQRQNEYIDQQIKGFEELIGAVSPEERLQIERYLEWQPGMEQVAISGKAKRIADEVAKPSRDRAARDFAYLNSKGVLDMVPDDYLQELTDGYLHRVRANVKPERHPFEPFAGVRGFRQKTASMEGRTVYALQRGSERKIVKGTPPATYGTNWTEPKTGIEWNVRRATTEEVERNSDIRYLHNPLLTTRMNEIQLKLARENYDFLQKDILPELRSSGLATTSREAGLRGRSRETQYRPSINPGVHGWYFEPRLAHAFDDFYRSPSIVSHELEDAAGRLLGINRFALNALFLDPIPHSRNVWSDYRLARGGILFNRKGFGRHLYAAYQDVMTNGDFLRDLRKSGGALMGTQAQNRIMWQAMIEKAQQEMVRLPEMEAVAKSSGVWSSAKDMAESIYNKSQRFMWGFHDLLLDARVREIMATQQLGMETAVKQAEKYIADYRVYATIGEESLNLPRPMARVLSTIMQDKSVLWFGRYHYNKLRAIASLARDSNNMMRGRITNPVERKEAVSRMAMVLFGSTIMLPAINYLLQQALGDPHAKYHMAGAMGIPQNLAYLAKDVAQGDAMEFGNDFLRGMLSIITPAVMVSELGAQVFNRKYIGGPPIVSPKEPGGRAIIKRGLHAGRSAVPPVQLLDPRSLIHEFTGITP